MLCCREPGKLYRPSRLLSRCVITLIAACVQLEKESLSLILFQEIRRTRRYRREIESYLDDCLIPGARPIYFFLPLFLTHALSLFFIFPFLRFDLSSSFLFPSSFFFSFFYSRRRVDINIAEFREKIYFFLFLTFALSFFYFSFSSLRSFLFLSFSFLFLLFFSFFFYSRIDIDIAEFREKIYLFLPLFLTFALSFFYFPFSSLRSFLFLSFPFLFLLFFSSFFYSNRYRWCIDIAEFREKIGSVFAVHSSVADGAATIPFAG